MAKNKPVETITHGVARDLQHCAYVGIGIR